jgi:hypothetical protein
LSVTRYITVEEVVNRALSECGLPESTDVLADTNLAVVQMRRLLTTCGQNLVEAHEWEILRREYSRTTVDGDYLLEISALSGSLTVGETVTGGSSGATGTVVSVNTAESELFLDAVSGVFTVGETITGGTSSETATVDFVVVSNGNFQLPDDFGYMIDQTHWDRSNDVPIGGPLSAQQWQYLKGGNLTSQTIYAMFRIMENRFQVYPQPPPIGLELYFEYISRNWIQDDTVSTTYHDSVEANDDIVLFKPTMIVAYLRFKFLDAKGFATQNAENAFAKAYAEATGGNKGAPILNVGMRRGGIHFLDSRNIPVTGYGG